MDEKQRAKAMKAALRALTSCGFTLKHFEVERAGASVVVDSGGRVAAAPSCAANPVPASAAEPILDDAAVTARILDSITAANRIVDMLQRAFVNFQAVSRGLDFDFDQVTARAANDAEALARELQQLRRQAR